MTRDHHIVLMLLCCLLPMAVLVVALFLNLSPALTALIALLLLIPLARRLLMVASGEDGHQMKARGDPWPNAAYKKGRDAE